MSIDESTINVSKIDTKDHMKNSSQKVDVVDQISKLTWKTFAKDHCLTLSEIRMFKPGCVKSIAFLHNLREDVEKAITEGTIEKQESYDPVSLLKSLNRLDEYTHFGHLRGNLLSKPVQRPPNKHNREELEAQKQKEDRMKARLADKSLSIDEMAELKKEVREYKKAKKKLEKWRKTRFFEFDGFVDKKGEWYGFKNGRMDLDKRKKYYSSFPQDMKMGKNGGYILLQDKLVDMPRIVL